MLDVIGLLGGIGVMLFVFAVGMEMPRDLLRGTGRTAAVVGTSAFVLPALSGMDHSGAGAMSGMMTPEQMGQLEQATGAAFDRLFLQQMTAHHTGAVQMAETELRGGQNTDARPWRSGSSAPSAPRSPRWGSCSPRSDPHHRRAGALDPFTRSPARSTRVLLTGVVWGAQ